MDTLVLEQTFTAKVSVLEQTLLSRLRAKLCCLQELYANGDFLL